MTLSISTEAQCRLEQKKPSRDPGTQDGNCNRHEFTTRMAGKRGKDVYAYGATDEYRYYATKRKVRVHESLASIRNLLEIGYKR